MSDSDNFNTKKDLFSTIKEVKKPGMPVDSYLQESANLDLWSAADRVVLIESGLDPLMLDDLSVRTGACRYAQSLWNRHRNTPEEAQKAWDEIAPGAYKLRDELLHDMRHAYRKNRELLNRVRAIADGTGDDDMIQDMSDIAVFGKANPDELVKIKLDMTKLDQAASTSVELAPILAASNGEEGADAASVLLRNQAYTHLKEAVDEIRAAGKYKFWKNKARLKGYRSNYYRDR